MLPTESVIAFLVAIFKCSVNGLVFQFPRGGYIMPAKNSLSDYTGQAYGGCEQSQGTKTVKPQYSRIDIARNSCHKGSDNIRQIVQQKLIGWTKMRGIYFLMADGAACFYG